MKHHPGCDCTSCLLERILVVLLRLEQEFKSKTLGKVEITVMPKTITVGGKANAHITATKADGSVYTLTAADTLALAAAVPADVTFGTPTFNADGSADVSVTGVNVDSGDVITATVDGVASNPDTLTITAAVPSAVTLTLQ